MKTSLKTFQVSTLLKCTGVQVWKFQDFSITLILREINFENSSNAKLAILTHLEALILNLYKFGTFSELKFTN